MNRSISSEDGRNVIGIDIGSVCVAIVEIAPDKSVVHRAYDFHRGDMENSVLRLLKKFDLDGIGAVAATASTPDFICADARFDNQIAIVSSALRLHPDVGCILNVGGEKFGLLLFDAFGRYQGYRTNTSCAAGTGSFLDQQAGRLNLSDVTELTDIAAENSGEIPRIASRCAVFAKTDLIHAQQEGYTIAEICDGLCQGLAKNIVDTLFKNEAVLAPLIFCGGVARNQAVVRHISDLVGMEVIADEMAPFYGALGAAICLVDEGSLPERVRGFQLKIVDRPPEKRLYGHDPLALRYTDYPEFLSESSFEYRVSAKLGANVVEVDVYEPLESGTTEEIYLGMDIGSTSTKAVWMRPDKTVIAGFYTRTSGRPVNAMCSLLAAMDDLAESRGFELDIIGMGTTGSGRKFVGKMAGADTILDEITAHARAAVELHPDVDTIIEIGGQDSKFTTLKRGRVTFSVMNTVCAAGTGSFIEEQAAKLGCPLSEYSARAEKVSAPIASDRCTVFMERDINDYLGRGYSIDEVLASALHSVRENYLTKVALQSAIGEVICFQGATAKNRALIAAFEQRLNRPVLVSRFCHLTGALGVALHLSDQNISRSSFRGLDLYKAEIPVRSEVCSLCNNHCKITVADMVDGPVAYGFLCGRDYDTGHFVNNNRSGFDLYKARKKALAVTPKADSHSRNGVTIGLPAGLYMADELSMWIDFFNRLNIRVVTSERLSDPVKRGKGFVGAEFCAPMTAMHGHVADLLDRCDYVFLPFYLDNRQNDTGCRRQYCYYSQYIPSLIASMGEQGGKGGGEGRRARIVSPVIRYLHNIFHVRLELYRAIRGMVSDHPGFLEVSAAFERTRAGREDSLSLLRKVYEEEKNNAEEISVMLLGRPYSVLDRGMNKNIPDIFASLGVKCFFQDMLDYTDADFSDIDPFLKELHWNYAADILKAAKMTADSEGVYPVLVTSFKCSPDSFIRDVFQQIMEAADKPYLVVELDEHGSSVGYETRIEAAVRAFRNHFETDVKAVAAPDYQRVNPVSTQRMEGKTVVFPNWDPITSPLLVATLKREGFDVRLMRETPGAIRRSMRLNSGQCIPINIMVQEFVEYVEEEHLDPGKTALWMGYSEIACNIRLYPYQCKKMIESFGPAMAEAGVYTGAISFADVSLRAARNGYFAYMFGGMVRKMGCKTRPYEINPGDSDRAIQQSIGILEDAFVSGRNKEDAVAEVVDLFAAIPISRRILPKVAIFGDLYARDNPVFNQDLIAFIESHGAEVITAPYTEYAKMIAPTYFKKWFAEGKYFNLFLSRTLLATMVHQEKTYYRLFGRVLQEPEPIYDTPPGKILSEYSMIEENTGESMDNILKIYYIKKHHPDVSLFVQTSPAFCCPSLVTEAMAKTIEKNVGVPVVSITYDGTGGDKNEKIIPYLKMPGKTRFQDIVKATGSE